MNRIEFIDICSKNLKLVRTEYNYTQDTMSCILGVSKKTLVQVEKNRSSLSWSLSVTLCSIFKNSQIISNIFGGSPTDIIMALAFDGKEPYYPQTKGGKVWWNDIMVNEKYKLQQNILCRHYRILDKKDRRICSSFSFNDVKERFGK